MKTVLSFKIRLVPISIQIRSVYPWGEQYKYHDVLPNSRTKREKNSKKP